MTTTVMMKAYAIGFNSIVSVPNRTAFSIVMMNTTFNTTFDTDSSSCTAYDENFSVVSR